MNNFIPNQYEPVAIDLSSLVDYQISGYATPCLDLALFFDSMALYKQTSTNITTKNNGYCENANNEMGTQGSDSIVIDPCFSEELLPQQYQFRIGGVDGVDTDVFGNPNTGCIGAVQPQRTEYFKDKMPKYISGGGLIASKVRGETGNIGYLPPDFKLRNSRATSVALIV